MNNDEISKMQQILNELKVRLRADSNVPTERMGELYTAIRDLENALSEYRTTHLDEAGRPDVASLERLRRKLWVVQTIQGIQNPSYFDEFASTLAEHPYALPKALFDPQGRDLVTIDFPGNRSNPQFHKERLDLALRILYPGSFTYRYGVPMKIETGQFSRRFVANLKMHMLSPDPIFKTDRDGRKIDVYKPISLRSIQVDTRNPYICTNCLSVSGLDEGCSHAQQVKKPLRLPSSSPVTTNQELDRMVGSSIALGPPLSAVIQSVAYLEKIRVGQAVLGFERSAASRVTIVDYDPPIGMVLETKGLAFKFNIPEKVLDQLTTIPVLFRDVLTQLLAHKLAASLALNGVPSYYLEPILSGLVSALRLDEKSKDISTILAEFTAGSWVEDAVHATMSEGANYYERFDVQDHNLRDLYQALSRQAVNTAIIREEIKKRLLHSLAHNLLIAGCITAGCLPSDLEYLIADNEIILFDTVDGGNGSSAMIFEFVSSRDSFSLEDSGEKVAKDFKETTFRPKYFDEALLELMLPCQQGVSERIFHRGLPIPQHQEISRRIAALERQREVYSDAYQLISGMGVENCFIASLGLHVPLGLRLDINSAERLKESFSVCLHGCPDCLALGNRCDEGGFLEKFSLSKEALDEYYRYVTKPYTLDFQAEDSAIESVLTSYGVAILTMIVSTIPDEGTADKLQQRVSEFRGRKLRERFIKYAGFWVDSPVSTSEVRFCALLVLV
jgi:hypothetical protein